MVDHSASTAGDIAGDQLSGLPLTRSPLPGRVWRAARRRGNSLFWFARYWLLFGLAEHGFDRRLPVTTREVLYETGTVVSPNLHHGEMYEATPVALARAVLRDIPERLRDFTFIDFGSGRGRMLLVAAERPFRRVLGVEYSRELHEAAVANIACRGLSHRVESLHADAAAVQIPPGPCVLYLYNPFDDAVLQRVVRNIEEACRREPRRTYVLYFNAVHANVLDKSPLLRPLRLGWFSRLRQRLMVVTSMRMYRTG